MGDKYTEAQKKATYKYLDSIDRMEIRLPKGTREKIKDHAAATGESVNAFIGRAIDEAISNDDLHRKN